MAETYIYDHVRTPRGRGKKDGSLHEVPAVRLAAKTLEWLQERNGFESSSIDDVILGCVDPVGEAGADIARAAVFEAGYDNQVPGMQINRFCASGLDAVNMGASKIAAGSDDIVIAGLFAVDVNIKFSIRRGMAECFKGGREFAGLFVVVDHRAFVPVIPGFAVVR